MAKAPGHGAATGRPRVRVIPSRAGANSNDQSRSSAAAEKRRSSWPSSRHGSWWKEEKIATSAASASGSRRSSRYDPNPLGPVLGFGVLGVVDQKVHSGHQVEAGRRVGPPREVSAAESRLVIADVGQRRSSPSMR